MSVEGAQIEHADALIEGRYRARVNIQAKTDISGGQGGPQGVHPRGLNETSRRATMASQHANSSLSLTPLGSSRVTRSCTSRQQLPVSGSDRSSSLNIGQII